jgi:hypothetical protein
VGGVPPRRKRFFFSTLGISSRDDEEMVDDREVRQPGGEFENTGGSVQVKGSRVLQINISPTSGVLDDHRVGVHQVLNVIGDQEIKRSRDQETV